MKRLLSSTTALSLAFFNVQPWPLMAQTLTEDGSVIASDGTVLCQPTDGNACNPDDYVAAAQAIDEAAAAAAEAEAAAAAQAQAEAEAQAAAEAQAQAEAEAQAAAEAQAQADAEAQAAAEAAAQAEAEAQAQAEAEAAAAAEAAAQAQAEAEAQAAEQAQAEAEAAAAAEAQVQAEAEAKAAADAAAEAEAAAATATEEATAAEPATDEAVTEEPATDEAVVEEPAAEAATTDEAVTEEPAAEEATTDEAVTEEPATDEAAAEEPATDEATTDEAATEEATTDEAATTEPATDAAATEEPVTEEAATTDATTTEEPATEEPAAEATTETAPEATAETEATTETTATDPAAEPVVEPTMTVPDADTPVEDAAAGMKVAEPDPAVEVTPVEAPTVTAAEVESLTEILAQPDGIDPAAIGAAATLAAGATIGDSAEAITTTGEPVKLEDQPVSKDAVVTMETLTKEFTRTSGDEFARAPVAVSGGKKSGLSDLEKVGLFALGALVVGAVINEGRKDERKVVSNTGDRIVVLKPDGTYQVYKDDDAVLRRPGSTVRTETFRDGSTRSIVERADGSQIVTIRDASGRVLRRAQYDSLGRELVLIDDLEPEEVVVVSKLPKPRKDRVTISTKDENAALKAALAAKEAAKAGRKFSLRQIREIPEVRALAATIDVESVTFDSGSAAIKAGEAENLADLGGLMQDLLDANPGEMFLIEGHTDAVGKAPMNLALSDRRAESVALALTEYFDIPPENMVVQGYGESELLIDTQADERANRRVLVRVVTPLLKRSEQN